MRQNCIGTSCLSATTTLIQRAALQRGRYPPRILNWWPLLSLQVTWGHVTVTANLYKRSKCKFQAVGWLRERVFARAATSSHPSRAPILNHYISKQAQNMTVNAVSSKCPFLTRVPSTFLGRAGPSLNMYGQRCPVMGRLFHRAATGGAKPAHPVLGTKTLTLGE